MKDDLSLNRFIEAQESSYERALTEIKNGKKTSHWMWYIFPQLKVLGLSDTAKYYGLVDANEAEEYLKHPTLGKRLIEISTELLKLQSNDANEILGSPDDMKLKSSMTLFGSLKETDPIFKAVLTKFYEGREDERTLELLNGK